MNRTQPMARIRASDLSALVGEALCKPHLDAMDAYLRKVSYFNTQAKESLRVGDFEGANRAAGQSIDASKHYDYERFLADRCRRGEPEGSAPSFFEFVRPKPKPSPMRTVYDAEPGAWGDWGRRSPMPWRGFPFQSTPSTFPVSPGLPVGSMVEVPTGSGYVMSGDLGSADDYAPSVSIPMARQALEAAVQLHRQRPTAQTKRRVAYLEGLLDDYMKDWEDFRSRHAPPPVRYTNPSPSTAPAQPPIDRTASDKFCNLIKVFLSSQKFDSVRLDAIEAFRNLLNSYPAWQRDPIRKYIEELCPSVLFFSAFASNQLETTIEATRRAHGSTAPTRPYVAPGPSVATGEPGFPMPQPVRRPTGPTSMVPMAPLPARLTLPYAQGPVQAPAPAPLRMPVPTVSTAPTGPGRCPPGQFWDGRQCRGSVTTLPGLPGGLPSGGGATPFVMSGFPFHRKGG